MEDEQKDVDEKFAEEADLTDGPFGAVTLTAMLVTWNSGGRSVNVIFCHSNNLYIKEV